MRIFSGVVSLSSPVTSSTGDQLRHSLQGVQASKAISWGGVRLSTSESSMRVFIVRFPQREIEARPTRSKRRDLRGEQVKQFRERQICHKAEAKSGMGQVGRQIQPFPELGLPVEPI